ncbi:hypothetical protein ACFSCZ_16480 [Siminovitchia sediminis]|uniref:Uncharacterized protein n=1 Tax=Siminovitchia sediminis TaxID=1274353 RepID=A0ABW4KJK1_9BACI
MSFFQVGSIAIPTIWIAAFVALFIAAMFNRIVTGKKAGDWYWNGFFYYFILWKLSYVVFNLNLFLDMPMSILYFNGGTKGHIFALVILSIYMLIFASKRFPFLYEESVRLFLLYFISYKVIIGFLEKNNFEILIHLVLLSIFLFLEKGRKTQVSGQLFLLFILLELLIISSFGSILSLESVTIIWMGLIAIILGIRADKEAI